ncbi:helix-turn-helix domain-containing protein [Vibrio anguillarum]|uniref:helix-turn-helix domain-containing protein n=1 Tax=Vibrio anguillarum TaxID=55601 RepID=UPI00188DBC0F|nr:helix-turn-helix domain-containing protein [Vibrio anguillarum]MBF4322884.1 helix-turn-helix domain-containing protein [Vibrio anguillarum]MBF4426179.1 helix-turn-helix domain-containing protein [Vibrio anguillarum]
MIGDVLKEARIKINLSQSDMASKMGVTKQTYMKWENNITEPKASQVTTLANLLNITEKEICRGKLNKRMSLSAFIHRLNAERPSSEMETLKLWECADDHEELFESMKPKTEEEYFEMRAEEEFVNENRY